MEETRYDSSPDQSEPLCECPSQSPDLNLIEMAEKRLLSYLMKLEKDCKKWANLMLMTSFAKGLEAVKDLLKQNIEQKD